MKSTPGHTVSGVLAGSMLIGGVNMGQYLLSNMLSEVLNMTLTQYSWRFRFQKLLAKL